VYYHPLKGYAGPDSFEFEVALASKSSRDDSTLEPQSRVGTVGVHVRVCRRYAFDTRTFPARVKSSLCACSGTEEKAFGDEEACAAGVASVCSSSLHAASYTLLCEACRHPVFGDRFESTACRAQVERAASVVRDRGYCDPIAKSDCRDELTTADAPEPYVSWPARSLITPDSFDIVPLGSLNPVDGMDLPRFD